MTNEDPIVLLVDDLDAATELMRIVFERAGYVEPLRLASDGEQAIAYLRGDSGSPNYTQHGMPTVVLLDLNMPRKNGFEVLEWIRKQPALNQLCVCILSASNLPEDIARAYDLGANAYLVKPGNLAGLMHMATSLLAWLRLVQFAPLEMDEGSAVPAMASGGGAYGGESSNQGAYVRHSMPGLSIP
jgi:CheY-like chemotaxis protein